MAELALAVVPICLVAIKGINTVRKRLKTFYRYGREIKRLRKRFSAQTDIFFDECQLLLQEILDRKDAEAMVEDVNDERWTSATLEEGFRTYLRRKYRSYGETMCEIRDHIASLNDSLNNGDERDLQILSSENLRQAFDMMVNKSKYETSLSDLKEAISDLKRIRKTAGKLQNLPERVCGKRPRDLPISYRRVAQNSKSFYDALQAFWSCLRPHHVSHEVRLLLESRTEDSLRIVVMYCTSSGKQPRDNLLELIVHSRSLHLLHVSIPSGISSGRVTCSEERPKKTRRVRFVGECSDLARHGEEAGTASTTLTSATEPHVSEEVGLNLCSTRDMCTQICSQAHHIGYFDAPDHIRHQLSPVHDRGECIVKNMLSEPAQLDRIFELPVERAISVPQQVSIALRLARSVLRLHSTPWLQPLWTLRDLSYFQTDECLATSLETLHITNELLHQRLDSVMTDANVLVQAQRECGIRNLTMHSLGVALLQIGQWNSLKPDDIADVRRIADLAGHDSRLGPRYQKIAQRCMDCDFGFGKDLAQPELQNAVYRDVVCELESLVRTLEG
ncbi:hypothetical protein BKA67DRAFT_76623 [Truncatella angustata]|uniref:DUF7580 domain-containing protein n=1 Tax=Truncatella angustata TaxID=152316 RepID=A0A9P8UZB9_9PEZI|nr:uncharacterized protein BKA67DRAFT_76623 [Truncatella angustata]KAH6661153.1 hypothetical protein BKA67DRAFT_76623 [Truncatella angustata]